MNKTCSGSNKLCEKIRKYILNTEEYHITEADKNNILVSILKCTWLWNFLLSNPGVKYNDLLIIAILCYNDNDAIAHKIVTYGISHIEFNNDIKKCMDDSPNTRLLMDHINTIKSISFYDKCLSFACQHKFDKMISFIMKFNPLLCSTCLNVLHCNNSLVDVNFPHKLDGLP